MSAINALDEVSRALHLVRRSGRGWPGPNTWMLPLTYLAGFLDDYDDNGRRSEDRELMSDSTVENLILNLLAWLADGERSYEDVISVWRTSCPRLPVWEDANDRGLVTVVEVNGRCVVRVTRVGLALLDRPIEEPGSSK